MSYKFIVQRCSEMLPSNIKNLRKFRFQMYEQASITKKSINNAIDDVRKFGNHTVPLHLRNAPTELMESLGYGKEYKYVHNYSGNFVDQQYLPDALIDKQYYFPSSQGYEITINDQIKKRNDHISN